MQEQKRLEKILINQEILKAKNKINQKKPLRNRKEKESFKSKIKEIEQNLLEIEESLFKLNKYYDYIDIEYKGIKDVANLFNGVSTFEDYYRPTKTKSAFNGNYIEYESKGDKDKNLSPK